MNGLPSLPGRFLQRLAERFCTPEACQRLLFPIVADLQFEWQNAPTATFVELRALSAERQAVGDGAGARRAAVEWYKKPALGAACLVLALTGLALAGLVRRSAARVLLALLISAGYFMLLRMAEIGADSGELPPALVLWGPAAALLLLALLMAERGARLAARPGAG